MLNRNFREFVGLLDARGVEYLVIGGYAVGFHGHPRYTGDLDILVAVSPDNAEKLVEVFAAFGFPNSTTKEDFMEEGANVVIGEPPQRIHVLTGIAAVTFDECYRGRAILEYDGLVIPFIGLDALLKNKRALHREQDELDVKRLSELQRRSQARRDGTG